MYHANTYNIRLRLGFKPKCLLIYDSIILRETLLYYVSHNSVYCAFLDAKKLLTGYMYYCKLFRLLM